MTWVQTQTRLDKLTMAELQARRMGIQADPVSLAHGKRGPWIYTRQAQKKLDDIAWAISRKLGAIRSY